MMRWQARLEAGWADRYLPWIAAVTLAIVYFTLAEARVRSLDAGGDLAAATQGVWLIGHGHSPDLTITGTHLLAQHLPIGMYPVALVTRVLPAIPTLLALQSLGLAMGVIPLWRIARGIAELRVGAAVALTVAYGASPTLNNLNLSDFPPRRGRGRSSARRDLPRAERTLALVRDRQRGGRDLERGARAGDRGDRRVDRVAG